MKYHSNGDLLTCEDNMLFSRVEISRFLVKAHLVFHWSLYNKKSLSTFIIKKRPQTPIKRPQTTFKIVSFLIIFLKILFSLCI